MQHFITKGNTALMLFGLKRLNIKDKQKEFLVWAKLFDSFHYDEEATLNLIYINHPLESFIGFSLSATPDILAEKVKRYSEGLAYLLVYYFKDADISVLTQDECLGVVNNLIGLRGIPLNMRIFDQQYMNGEYDQLQVLFARVVDPQLILDKFCEFYQKYKLQRTSYLETRIGVKPKCDPRILQLLNNAYLAYNIRIFNVIRIKNVGENLTDRGPIKNLDSVRPFFENMGVPDLYVQKIVEAKEITALLDDPELILVPPETVAEFLLGYK